jgi:hypothetical protein
LSLKYAKHFPLGLSPVVATPLRSYLIVNTPFILRLSEGDEMKKIVVIMTVLVFASLGFAGAAKADSFTGMGNVIWTWTNEGSDGAGVFDVQLTVDASNATTGSSVFNVLSVQLSSGGTNGVVSLESTSSNLSGWSTQGPGNVNQCGGGMPPFYCSSTLTGPTITTGLGSNGIFTFLFDVTGLTSAPDTGDVQALQGSLTGSDGSYAISQSFGVGTPTSSPEPGSLMMLGAGLLGLALLTGRRALTA